MPPAPPTPSTCAHPGRQARRLAAAALFAAVGFSSFTAAAQTQDAFVEALVAFVTAVDGPTGDEGAAVLQALRAMDAGLMQWDRGIAAAESGMSAQIGSAPAEAAVRMRTALGLIYLQRGRVSDALAQLGAAAGPRAPADIHLFHGWALHRAGRSEQAADAFRRAFDRDPSNPALAYLVVHHHGRASERPAAVSQALAAIHAAEARIARSSEPFRFLVPQLLDDSAAPEPLFAWAAYADGYQLVSQERYAEAVERLRASAAADPLVTASLAGSSHGGTGAAALRAGDAPRAVAAFAAAVDENPASSEAQRMLGVAYWMDRQYDRSAEHLKAAISRHPLDERARILLADVLVAAGRTEDAEQMLLDTLRVLPRSGQAHWRLGRLYRTFGRERDALAHFESAVATQPLAGRAAVHRLIGQLRENHFDAEGALDAFGDALDTNPNDPAAHRERAEALQAIDRLDEARAEFVITLLLDSADVPAWIGLGQIHAAEDRLDAAVTAFRRATALEPRNVEARYALARALVRLGRSAEGQQELEAFERLQEQAVAEERQRYLDRLEEIERAVDPASGVRQP